MEVVKTMLETLGHNVTAAWDGSECIECLFDPNGKPLLDANGEPPERLGYDLIFMDCNMPVMDGYEATTFIRKAEARLGLPPTPVIALTAYAMPGDCEKCLGCGMTDYLTKPMSKQMLRKMVNRYSSAASRSTNVSSKASTCTQPSSTQSTPKLHHPRATGALADHSYGAEGHAGSPGCAPIRTLADASSLPSPYAAGRRGGVGSGGGACGSCGSCGSCARMMGKLPRMPELAEDRGPVCAPRLEACLRR